MLGDAIPSPVVAVHVTGVMELLGVSGIWLQGWRRATGFFLIAMMIAFLPFNICAAIDRVPFGGHEFGPFYLLVRVPFQFLVIWWIGKATSINVFEWLCRKQKQADRIPA